LFVVFNPIRTGYHGVHHGPGEVKLDLTFWPITRDRRGLNMKIPVHEGCCVYDVSPRYRVCPFWELALIGAVPMVHLERARDQARLWTCHPSHSPQPGTRNWSVFWPARRQTADHSPARLLPPWVVCSIKTKQKGGGGVSRLGRGQTSDRNMSKSTSKCLFWGHDRSSKTLEDVSVGICIF
jgi:hypothetical protein